MKVNTANTKIMHNFEQHFGPSKRLENLMDRAGEWGYVVYDGLPEDPGWKPLDVVDLDGLDTTTNEGRGRYQRYTEETNGEFGLALPFEDDDVLEGQVYVVGRTVEDEDIVAEVEVTEIVDEPVETTEEPDGQEAGKKGELGVAVPGIDKKDIIRQIKIKNALGETVVFTVVRGG